MSQHESPSGFTFTLRKVEQVPERLRRPVEQMLVVHKEMLPGEGEKLTGEALRFFNELNDLVAVALLTAWSADLPISAESLMELSKQDYQAIREAVAPFVWDMFPDFSVDPDPKSPSEP